MMLNKLEIQGSYAMAKFYVESLKLSFSIPRPHEFITLEVILGLKGLIKLFAEFIDQRQAILAAVGNCKL